MHRKNKFYLFVEICLSGVHTTQIESLIGGEKI